MSRIKVAISGNLLATIRLRVRITDINYGNHTGNDAIVGFLQEARMQWLENNGATELDIDGKGLIMAGLAVEFKAETYYGDNLQIKLYCDNVTEKSFDLFYHISCSRS